MPRRAEGTSPSGVVGSWRCGAPARWLPRVAAAALLASALLVSSRAAAREGVPFLWELRFLVLLAAVWSALWVVRRGGELNRRVTLTERRLDLEAGARRSSLDLADLESVHYEPPLARSRSWLPAVVLLDSRGRSWRLPTLLDDGPRLVGEIVRAAGRDDLATWVEVLGLERRMARGRLHLLAGYLLSGALVLAAVAWFLH